MAELTDPRFCFVGSNIVVTPNWRSNPQYLYVKASADTRVKISPSASNLISYNPITGAAPEWTITSENMFLAGIARDKKAYLYLRLLADSNTGILALSAIQREDWLTKEGNYLYLHIGELSAVGAESAEERILTLINGTLGSDQQQEETGAALYARKDRDDDINSLWKFHPSTEKRRGIVSEDYVEADDFNNMNGKGFAVIIDLDGRGIVEADSLLVRNTANIHNLVVKRKTLPEAEVEDGESAVEDGSAIVEGDALIEKDLHVEGDATVEGDVFAENDVHVHRTVYAGSDENPNADAFIAKARVKLRNTNFGDYIKNPMGVGALSGAHINTDGQMFGRSLELSESLTVPELRFNRALVQIGLTIRSAGGGIIDEVIPDTDNEGNLLNTGTAVLRLEDGEYGAIDTEDLNMGFWHFEGNGAGNAQSTYDGQNGDYTYAGFASVYFRITEITDAHSRNSTFRYVLRSGYSHHPHAGMHFGLIANTSNSPAKKYRQEVTYETPTYKVRTENRTDWTYDSSNIYSIEGQLDGFSMQATYDGQTYTKEFDGNGSVLGNAYIFGKLDQFERIGYRCQVDGSLGHSMFPDETEIETVMVFDGYGQDVTSRFTRISVTRESGDAVSDAAWNVLHTNVGNPFNIAFPDLGIDGITRTSTLFRVTASDELTSESVPGTFEFNT